MSSTVELELTSATSARVRVPEHAAVFAGHFPGEPILPGAALLQVMLGAADALWLSRGRAVRLARLRFLRPVTPACELRVEISPRRGACEVRALALDDDLVATCVVHLDEGRTT